ncbi:ribonuclease domain-containing protein [Sinomonas atrocyanea]|jgi:ribonuclease T1|uniref:ribonuclease domain-containing protein n=1 Tax=Sinomonas atrocyanea TaxID=37927 RepID=UPI002786E79E|nr:ribonuclease domain-containing protein [Sinomonas atrocyanea]MDQ0259612.1 ribonuclease T1 [Sinomonas atrocyanea]MDR6623130.1 ribonuclease T1 [Sinomonas atrocyanea]
MRPALHRAAVPLVLLAVAVPGLLSACGGLTADAGRSPSPSASAPVAAPSTARTNPSRLAEVRASQLPREARDTLARIARGGPYPYSRDGVVYSNFEKILPARPSGYYHEYTVTTPGSSDRGARRIVAGQQGDSYYTDDHYASFRFIREDQ